MVPGSTPPSEIYSAICMLRRDLPSDLHADSRRRQPSIEAVSRMEDNNCVWSAGGDMMQQPARKEVLDRFKNSTLVCSHHPPPPPWCMFQPLPTLHCCTELLPFSDAGLHHVIRQTAVAWLTGECRQPASIPSLQVCAQRTCGSCGCCCLGRSICRLQLNHPDTRCNWCDNLYTTAGWPIPQPLLLFLTAEVNMGCQSDACHLKSFGQNPLYQPRKIQTA